MPKEWVESAKKFATALFKGREIGAPSYGKILDKTLFRDLDRRLFRDRKSLKALFALSLGEDADDAEIIDRVVSAYKLQEGDAAKPSAVWNIIYNSRQIGIHDTLVGDDRKSIENLLRRPGDSNLFYGFDGTTVDFVQSIKRGERNGDDFSIIIQDHLIRLAEIMGALPYEHIDGGDASAVIASYGAMNTDDVLDAIDSHLGAELRYANPFPDEYGIPTRRGIVSYHVPHAIYHAWRVRELVKSKHRPRVAEIGGGLGRAAYFAWQLGITDYTIIDLPLTGLSQGYFLMRSLGASHVYLHGETDNHSADKIKLLQPSAFLNGDCAYDLIINANSMTEMSLDVAHDYWSKIRTSTKQFISINHEANAFRMKDIAEADSEHVVEAQRYPYGLRKSYAEEIFRF